MTAPELLREHFPEPAPAEQGEERVIAAAIRLNGVIYAGRRHNEIIDMLVSIGMPTPISGDQGFIDASGAFLDRHAAGDRAVKLGQIDAMRWPGMGLDSVELFPRSARPAPSSEKALREIEALGHIQGDWTPQRAQQMYMIAYNYLLAHEAPKV
jgi:hypothetical protein